LIILKNILPAIKLYDSLKYISGYKKEIFDARKKGDFEREREYILKSTKRWGDQLVKVYDIQLNIAGKENLPDRGPVVFVANHQGYADIPITCAVLDKFQFGFIAKSNLEKLPAYGKWIENIRSVFIQRDDVRASLRAIDEGVGFIEKGFSLLIFPEGTRSRGGDFGEFKKGSLRLATKPGVPVIPITINGTHRIYEDHGFVKNGAHVDITIHPVIETKGMDRSAANNLSAEVERIIKAGISDKPA
jgi:1-acyl-sn-glycerol-3-phosphate acyltransferase